MAWQLCPDLPGCSPPPLCPASGSCCSPNSTVGCNHTTCCETVCAIEPECCSDVWSQSCALLAVENCPSCTCGMFGSGLCCDANDTPFCTHADCCNTVCDLDPYCCQFEWNACCAELAKEHCVDPCQTQVSCEGYCAEQAPGGCWCDEACHCFADCCSDMYWGVCGFIPEPCVANHLTTCENACGWFAKSGCWCHPNCHQTQFGLPCCPDICLHCKSSTPHCKEADVTGDNIVDIFDLLAVLSQWGECPGYGTHCPDPAECPADLDGNGVVDIFDLLFILANWG